MFTRIPTFIPTETKALEDVKENQSQKREAKNPAYGIGQETSRRRKRAKAIKKRIAAKKAEDRQCEEAFPIISGRESRTRGHATQTSQTHLRSSKMFESRSFAAPYTTPVQQSRIILDLNRRAATLSDNSDTKNSKDCTVGAILSMETELGGEEADVLTHATMHTRHRRKLNDDTQDVQVKKQAKRLFHNHVEHEERNMDTTSRAGTSSNESTTSDTQSLIRTPLPADIQSSLRSPKTHHNETDMSRNFKSKIPVRFPDIQENKRYAESRVKNMKNIPNKLTTTLPPIANLHSSKNSPDSTGKVTQSIMDYQNIVEQDFKRLGENLENTFKLLHQYIKCNSNTHARA